MAERVALDPAAATPPPPVERLKGGEEKQAGKANDEQPRAAARL